MSTPDPKQEFHLDMTFTGQNRHLERPIAIACASVLIILIVASFTTNLADRILPMSDEYLQVLIPRAADGKEALSLMALDRSNTENTLDIKGTVGNRTEFPLNGIVALFEAQDMNGQIVKTVEVPLSPVDIPAKGTADFQTSISLESKPSGFSLKFKLKDGPFVPHSDDRAANYGIPPAAATTTPK